MKNHEATREAVTKDAKKKEDILNNLKKDLAAEEKALNAARGVVVVNRTDSFTNIFPLSEAARQASQKNLSLSEESLTMYNTLKAQANMRAVEERQALQALGRDEKTSARTLASLQEAYENREETRQRLEKETEGLEEKKAELEERVKLLQSDLSKAKKELNNQQAEYAKIRYADAFL